MGIVITEQFGEHDEASQDISPSSFKVYHVIKCCYCYLSFRIMEPWIKGEAAVGLVQCCLELNPNIKEIRCASTQFLNKYNCDIEMYINANEYCKNII